MNWKLLAVCLLIATSGCVIPEPIGVPTEVRYSGQTAIDNGQFSMQGDIVQRRGEETLDHVAVCGYTERQDLLFAEQIPPFESRESVEIANEKPPTYVIIYSTEFWDSDRFGSDAIDAVEYLQLGDDGLYGRLWAESPSELPIDTDRPLQNGCPA